MITQKYPDASLIPEKYLRDLVIPQIQCWGAEPHNEYKICCDESCGRIISIEEIHGKKGQDKIHDEESCSFACPECNSDTKYIYDKEKYFNDIKEYVTSKVSIVLLTTEDDEVKGFGVTSLTNIDSVSELEFATRPESYDASILKEELSQRIFNAPNMLDEEIVLFHQIYVAPELRSAVNTFRLLVDLFTQTPERATLPVIAETRYDGNFYPILRSMGFQDVMNDKYGYVAQNISSYKSILEFLGTHPSGYRSFLPAMKKFKGNAERIISKNPHFSAPLFYS